MKPSVVLDRVADVMGKPISVRTTWSPSAPFDAVLVDVFPFGRDYMVRLRIGERTRLISTTAILEMSEREA